MNVIRYWIANHIDNKSILTTFNDVLMNINTSNLGYLFKKVIQVLTILPRRRKVIPTGLILNVTYLKICP